MAVLAKELSPQARMPAIIPLTNTSTPLLSTSAALTSPPVVTCIAETSNPPITSAATETSTPVTSVETSTSPMSSTAVETCSPAVMSSNTAVMLTSPVMSTAGVTRTPPTTSTSAVTPTPPTMSTAAMMPTAVESTTVVTSTPALMPISNQEVLTFTPGIPRDIEIDMAMHHFIPLPELTQICNKSCSRSNMAVNLVRRLFNKQTRMMSNVSGHGKEMLDPVLVSYA